MGRAGQRARLRAGGATGARRRFGVGDGLAVATAAGLAAHALRMRRRARGLVALAPSDEPPRDDHVFVTARGVVVDDATRRAASAHARTEGLDVVELAPGDLTAGRAAELVGKVDPATYRADAFAVARGPVAALLVTKDVLRRSGIAELEGLAPAAFALAAEDARKAAVGRADVAVAPGLRAAPESPADRHERLWAQYDAFLPLAVVQEVAPTLLATLGAAGAVLRRSPWDLLPALVGAITPRVALGGSPLGAVAGPRTGQSTGRGGGPGGRRAPGPGVLGSLPRSGRDAVALLRAVANADPRRQAIEERRPYYDAELARGTDRFFGPRRPDCPACGGRRLSRYLTMPDVVQAKPGTFTLERCGGCGHTFQNPRLTAEGLAFYYRDFYDGLGERSTTLLLGAGEFIERARVGMIRGHGTPRRWLDVGVGHGHFCLAARRAWPGATFDGLDQSANVEVAARRGWLDNAHVGQLVDLAPTLAGAYDVVSMHAYLEHTVDPRAELAAAATVLAPGGFLQVEVPDPEFPVARLLGWAWYLHFQPQHISLLPHSACVRLMEEAGFEVVASHRAAAHVPFQDFAAAVPTALARVAPNPDRPWRPRATRATRARRYAAVAAACAAATVAVPLDLATLAYSRVADRGNTYRILARLR